MLIVDGSVALAKRLSVSQFWEEVSSSGATRSMMMSIGGFLLQQPPSPHERSHRLRTATAVPMMADAQKFEDRFGVRLTQAYGLTDCCLPLSQSLSDPPSKRFSIGRAMPGCQVRLVDDFDGMWLWVPLGKSSSARTTCPSPWPAATTKCPRPPSRRFEICGFTPAIGAARTRTATSISSIARKTRSGVTVKISRRSKWRRSSPGTRPWPMSPRIRSTAAPAKTMSPYPSSSIRARRSPKGFV